MGVSGEVILKQYAGGDIMRYDRLPSSTKYPQRWILYLDLLGFKRKIDTSSFMDAWHHYDDVMEAFEMDAFLKKKVHRIWWSDTFILYTPGSSARSFAYIESAMQNFFLELINKHKSARGAIACGDFYANKKTNTYFGKALIEAYQCAENLQSVGVALCDSAVKRLNEIKLPADERLDYARGEFAFKVSPTFPTVEFRDIYAYRIGGSSTVNGRNIFLDDLRAMSIKATENRDKEKYESAILFAEKNIRVTEEEWKKRRNSQNPLL
jgi:hypothetical protein